ITMSGGKISAYLTGPLDVTTIEEEDRTEVVRIQVSNSSGYELPSTGGIGTQLFTILGGLMATLAGAILLKKRKTA
ncbi:MAG: LPXTG cell wall anchor domain-containing protein, partial [Oscillospiraceae bacterium]|nr:LPXTG cell wall anchor domain-containing protein [Oscillospiraceae bacterium]